MFLNIPSVLNVLENELSGEIQLKPEPGDLLLILTSLDLLKELEWVNSITLENQKNYQIWHHRKVLIEKLNDPSHEKKLLDEIFEEEPKNFHAWCHRIWVVRRFNLFEGEFEFIENKLDEVRE